MMKLGDMVEFGGAIGYIVGIQIDPIDISMISNEIEDPIYTIRAFGNQWKNGYFNFKSTEGNLEKLKNLLKVN